MFRSLYRQRRRFALLVLAIGYSLWVHYGSLDGVRHAIRSEFHDSATLFLVTTGLSVAIIASAIAILITHLFPGTRRFVEVFAMATVVSDLMLRADAVLPALQASGYAEQILFLSCYFVIATALDRNCLDYLGLRAPLKSVVRSTVRATPEAIWAAMAPDESAMSAERRKLLMRIAARPDIAPDLVEVHYKTANAKTQVQHHAREVWAYPLHFRYRFAPADGCDAGGTRRGRIDMQCSPRSDGRTEVTLTQDYHSLSLGAWLMLWLDDTGRAEMDSLKARVEGRRDWSTQGWAMRQVARA